MSKIDIIIERLKSAPPDLIEEVHGLLERNSFGSPGAAGGPENVIRLQQTCSAYPEQYEAFDGDRQVGYLRLRHGRFTVTCPDFGGTEVYAASPNGDGDFDDSERDYFLRFAVAAIENWMRGKIEAKPAPPDVTFIVDP